MSIGDFAGAKEAKMEEKNQLDIPPVDISQWHRKEHLRHFSQLLKCTYNQTVQLDITAFFKDRKRKISTSFIRPLFTFLPA